MTATGQQLNEVVHEALRRYERRACTGILRLGMFNAAACLPWIGFAPAAGLYQLALTAVFTACVYAAYRWRMRWLLAHGRLTVVTPTSGIIDLTNLFTPGVSAAPITAAKMKLSMDLITLLFHLLCLPTCIQAYRLRIGDRERAHSYALYEDMQPLAAGDGRMLALVLPGLWMLPPSPGIVLLIRDANANARAARLYDDWLAAQAPAPPVNLQAVFPCRLLVGLGLLLYVFSLLLLMPLTIALGWFVPAILAFIIGFPIAFFCLRMRYGAD